MVHLAKWKVVLILGLSLLGIIFAAPNLLSREAAESLPHWLPHQQISLGLDLQGGSHLLFEVDTRSVINEELNALVDAARNTLRKERIFYTGLGISGNSVVFQLRDPADIDRVKGLIREFSSAVSGTGAGLGSIVGGLTSGQSLVIRAADQGAVTLELSDQAIKDRETRAVEQ
ncbi:MAG TPA: hypothetical protein VM713_01165, partial [Steroidobacteraceae bacterium]|nr:hypothetical protein [Steroidobacteraceae bacterium]